MPLDPEKLCLQTRRKVAGLIPRLNVKRTAEDAGVDVSKFHKWLKDKPGTGLSYAELFAICRVLNASLDWALDDDSREASAPRPPAKTYQGTPVRDRKITRKRGALDGKRNAVNE
jgi:transcriptional regulator with XRE-family HTH domain